MIVVDTNIVASLFLDTERSADVDALLELDSRWAAPGLWRSELRNVLALYLRQRRFDLSYALRVFESAAELIGREEYAVPTLEVLSHSQGSGCSAYDCEFVVLAAELGVPLVTLDRKLLTAFPQIAIGLAQMISTR